MSTPKKTQVKSQGSRVIDGPNGGKIRTGGNPGNKGGGRKPIDFLATCNTLADTLVLDEAKRILALGADGHDEWRWAAEYVSKYTKSEAPKRTVVEGDEKKPLTVVVRHE